MCIGNDSNTIPIFYVSLHMDSSYIGTSNSTNHSSVHWRLERSPFTYKKLHQTSIHWMPHLLIVQKSESPSPKILVSTPMVLVTMTNETLAPIYPLYMSLTFLLLYPIQPTVVFDDKVPYNRKSAFELGTSTLITSIVSNVYPDALLYLFHIRIFSFN